MFKIQMQFPGLGWLNVSKDMVEKIPGDVDVMAWLRKNFPSTDFRVVKVKEKHD